ncbi:ABC transporter ATP-binding protein [Halobacteriales archaeon QS_1_68_20]|nr:MAG: ABC transporter ATP-binding protein [Halobacteriales archaeon QS_1_68_20]
MVAIEMDGLTKRYGSGEAGVVAVDDLDLVVEEGEVFGFLGPNGAGKSTTINMLLGFVEPTAGTAEVLGMDARTEATRLRERVGILPEGYEVFERLTAREHVEWVKDTKGTDDDVDALLDAVGIPEAADRQAGGFSKGMRQRLALAMALVGDPDLLILDEPSSGLDPTGMQEMRELIREQAQDGTTVFFSSHLLGQVGAVCDRVGILHDGSLVEMDTIENLREESGGTSVVEVDVADVPEPLGLGDLDGVREVTVGEGTVTAVCEDPTVKVDVVRALDDRTTVTDIVSEETSLEELFNRYTGNGRGDGGDPVETGVTA